MTDWLFSLRETVHSLLVGGADTARGNADLQAGIERLSSVRGPLSALRTQLQNLVKSTDTSQRAEALLRAANMLGTVHGLQLSLAEVAPVAQDLPQVEGVCSRASSWWFDELRQAQERMDGSLARCVSAVLSQPDLASDLRWVDTWIALMHDPSLAQMVVLRGLASMKTVSIPALERRYQQLVEPEERAFVLWALCCVDAHPQRVSTLLEELPETSGEGAVSLLRALWMCVPEQALLLANNWAHDRRCAEEKRREAWELLADAQQVEPLVQALDTTVALSDQRVLCCALARIAREDVTMHLLERLIPLVAELGHHAERLNARWERRVQQPATMWCDGDLLPTWDLALMLLDALSTRESSEVWTQMQAWAQSHPLTPLRVESLRALGPPRDAAHVAWLEHLIRTSDQTLIAQTGRRLLRLCAMQRPNDLEWFLPLCRRAEHRDDPLYEVRETVLALVDTLLRAGQNCQAWSEFQQLTLFHETLPQ